MPYYYEQANFAGVYRPQKSNVRPTGKTTSGQHKIRQVTEIGEEEYRKYSLEYLETLYGFKEDLGPETSNSIVFFKYTNYRNETAIRECILLCIEYTSVPEYYGPEKQWFLQAFDCQKQDNRSFLLSKCDFTCADANDINIFIETDNESEATYG